MKKLLVLLLALFMAFSVQSRAYCAEGDELSTTSFRIDGNGEMWYQVLNETISTNDTVTAAESGKVFFISNGGGYASINMTLPAADEGLVYTFIQKGTGTLVELVPNGTDAFLYSTANASDHLRGPATAGATIEIFASDDSVWYVNTNGGTYSIIAF
jgi:hypothetical protein